MNPLASILSPFSGGGLSQSASTGPLKGGDIAGSTFDFGGINTGTQSTLPPWALGVGAAIAALALILYFAKRK